MLEQEPYLSVIWCSRNDDYGGDMLRRMHVVIYGLIDQLERYKINSEVILVEWNPPCDRPLLKDTIKWPLKIKNCTIRVIVVSSQIHKKFRYHNKIPLHYTCAMNCGIRRARGTFILASPIDNLFSDELISFISSKQLKPDCIYRIDRSDVNRDILKFNTLSEQLQYAKNNVVILRSQFPLNMEGLPNLHLNYPGDFQLMSKYYWRLLRGYWEDISGIHMDVLLSFAAYAAGLKEVVLKPPFYLYHIEHKGSFTGRFKVHKSLFAKLYSLYIPYYIRNKISSYTIYHKVVRIMNIYNIDSVPVITNSLDIAKKMVSKKISFILNNESWGLGNEDLPEFVISRAVWDKIYVAPV